MKVYEYIDYLIAGECNKLSIASVGDMTTNPGSPSTVEAANRAKFVHYINLANLALHKRFHLLKKDYEMDNPVDEEEFALPSTFLVPVHAYYADNFEPVTVKDESIKLLSDIAGTQRVDTSVSILIPEPFKAVIKGADQTIPVHDQIILRYAAAPIKLTSIFKDLKISEVYTEALLNYASYKAHSAISGNIKDENNTYYQRYDASCKQIVNSGMWGNNEIETNTKLADNGFV
jgi:hypothetical protein